ncbi:unnamed protein product [Rotaria sp. Silwood1]|nr:unnamed protein product [Rotaria sp. Silwood1]
MSNKELTEQIRAFYEPIDENRFSFTDQILTLSPVIRFDYIDEYSTFNVLIKWYHIGDHYAQKYVVCLDEKEVHYIDQLPVNKEIQICIHRMKPDKSHTVQIIAKLKNGKETNRSDLINFKVPCQEDQETYEVITVTNEPVPLHLLGFIVRHDDTKEKQSTSKYDRFKQRALELHRRLRLQIEKSGKY